MVRGQHSAKDHVAQPTVGAAIEWHDVVTADSGEQGHGHASALLHAAIVTSGTETRKPAAASWQPGSGARREAGARATDPRHRLCEQRLHIGKRRRRIVVVVHQPMMVVPTFGSFVDDLAHELSRRPPMMEATRD